MKLSLGSTSTRTFMVIPAAVLLEQAHRRRPLRPRWLPVMAWGFLQYCYVGRYRNRYGGGGPGLSLPPERLLSSGPYAVTRCPMYLGHLIFLAAPPLLCSPGPLLPPWSPWRMFPGSRGGCAETRRTSSGCSETSIE